MSSLFTFIFISTALVLVILLATYILNPTSDDYEKHSAYECGFEPFGDARSFFDIQFYTIGLLFIIFDLEVVFLIPVIADIGNISFFGYINLIVFLFVVLLGFYYEWAIGLLNWIPAKTEYSTISNLNFFLLLYLLDLIRLLAYIDTDFLIFSSLILLFLLMNDQINLIYRIINLLGLSLAVIGIWTCFTDLIFIYIGYIIAFIGAVLMLLLGVVLMLPASTIKLIKEYSQMVHSIFLFQIVTEVVDSSKYYDFLESVIMFMGIFFMVNNICKIILFITSDKEFRVNYAIYSWNIKIDWQEVTSLITLIYFIQAQLSLYKKGLRYLFGYGVAPHYYTVYSSKSSNMKFIPPVAWVGMYWHNFLFYVYTNIESKLYTKKTTNLLSRPVWNETFLIFNSPCSPAKHIGSMNWYLPEFCINYYHPVSVGYSIFDLLPYNIKYFPLICYLHGNSYLVLVINKLIFLFDCIIYISVHILYNIFMRCYKVILNWDVIFQVVYTITIFFLTVPVFFYPSYEVSTDSIDELGYDNSGNNLIAIKQILYEESGLYIFIPVVVLLIALIGSAIFTRNSKK